MGVGSGVTTGSVGSGVGVGSGVTAGVTVTITLAVVEFPFISFTMYETGVVSPVKSASGVKFKRPSTTVHVPSPSTTKVSTGSPFASTNLRVVGSRSTFNGVSLLRTSISTD